MWFVSGLFVIVLILAFMSFNVLREYQRAVVFFRGRYQGVKGPGLIVILPVVQQMVRVDLRTVVLDVPPQDVITRDNVSVKVSAVLYFRVVEPMRAVIAIENYLYASSMIAQTTLRSVCGQAELDHLLADRERLNQQLQRELDHGTDPWGVKVRAVEIKHIDLPQEMQRAMAKQAEAERERRAKVIHAQGEFEASQRLREASDIMTQSPYTLQLRYLQTLAEIAVEHNSTILFPMPLDLITPFLSSLRASSGNR